MLAIKRLKPKRFKIFIDPVARGDRRRYFLVWIFAEFEELRLFIREQWKILGNRYKQRAKYWRGCCGYASGFGRSRLRGRPFQVGSIFFCRRWIGIKIVAHEIAHASLYAATGADKHPIKIGHRRDERIATLAGEMNLQFWNWFYRQPETRRRDRAAIQRGISR